ncbi:MAG: EAL domain-containing protein [gamma proteobacterium endosymbiont of Lamellibrachia anaximandri]|nr:EAL domain-containing protein [gamma proteobacterium endosymbiont of Lamellibrachia anaximandri]
MQLQTKVLAVTAIVFLGHFVTVEYMGHRQVESQVVENIRDHARTVRGMLMSLRNVYQRHFLTHNIPVDEKTLGFLPAHSISRISKEFKKWVDSGLTFNNVSDRPRNPNNRADEIEMEAIRHFQDNPEEKERMVPFAGPNGEPFYHFSQPIWIKPHCLKCHGKREDAPPSIRERYNLAYEYELGDLRGVMSIKLPGTIIAERVAAQTRQNIISHSIGFILTFLILSWLLRQTIINRIGKLKNAAQRLAQGNYAVSASMLGEDEISHVAAAFNEMAEKIGLRERALTTQKSMYAALSQTNKTIIRLHSPEQLFEKVCNIAVELGGLKFAWIGLVDAHTSSVEPIASAGDDVSCLAQTEFSLDPDHTKGSGPLSISINERRHVVINNLHESTITAPWQDLARKAHIHSAAIFPITMDREVIGVFCVYSGESEFFNADIVDLLHEMATDISFAIGNYKQAKEHETAHKKLSESSAELEKINSQMRLLLESTGEGIYGIDTKGNVTFVNQSALKMLGFSREELLGGDIHALTHHTYADGTTLPIEECSIHEAFRTGLSCQINNEVFWRKNGTSFPVEYSAYPINEEGEIKGAVTVFRDVTESHAIAQQMNFLATHDTLTNLLNRYSFEKHLSLAFNNAQSGDVNYALCYMDLDQFKVVNDTCGHVAGDALLQMVSRLLQQTIRHSDILSRLGGDEFGLLLEDCPLEQAILLANKICENVKDFRFSWQEKTFTIGVSIGIVSIDHESEGPESALSAADAACYVAKDLGRNRVHVHRSHDDETIRRQGEMQWVSRIQRAIEEKRLCLYQQPIVPLDDDEEAGQHFEILLRMTDEDGRMVPPGAFIPAAERYNLMPTLDRWVIDATFQWLADNPTRVADIELCAINLSGQSLGDNSLPGYITDKLNHYNLDANTICFEVTETAAVSRLDQAIHFITNLKHIGCRFALDDFGTGMSSFAYLKNMPVDYLKIDGSFVKDIADDPIDRAMVESISEIGHLMGLETIGEYVENDAIRKILTSIGVDYAQGFGIAKPQPLGTLDEN